jgi:MoaA/NifB/PqqE/SkfB family radical SAM enzyme
MDVMAFCGYPWSRCRVTSEGQVAMCCFMRPDPLAASESEAYIGNVLENSFDEIWFGDVAESIRQDTLAGKLHKKCQTPGCPFFTQNTPYQKQHIIYNEYPNFLEIDLPNTHCNVGGLNPDPEKSPACIMCERSSPFFRPEKDRLFEVLEKIKYIVPNLRQIHIQGIAEPFYESRQFGYLLFDILDVLEFDKYAHQITISVTTNGTLLKRNVRQEYLSRVPHSITNFSIDAATPETFKNIRILIVLIKCWKIFMRSLRNVYVSVSF